MKVRDIMTKKLVTVSESTSFHQAAEVIFSHHISGLPVVDDKGQCVGIISEKDLLQALFPTYSELFQMDNETPLYTLDLENLEHHATSVTNLKVKDLMNRQIIMVDSDTPVLQAASMMVIYRVRRLPVIDNGKLVGIVSQGDVFRSILKSELGFTPIKQRPSHPPDNSNPKES